MSTHFRTMSLDQRLLLKALNKKMTYGDLCAKLADTFERGRVMGLLQNLRFRGFIDNRNRMWFRTEAGDRVAAKSDD